MHDDQQVPPLPYSNVSSHTAARYLRFNEARTIAVNLADRLARKRQRLVLLHLDLIAPLPRGAHTCHPGEISAQERIIVWGVAPLYAMHGALAPSRQA